MKLGKLIAELQEAEKVLSAEADVVVLMDNWWDCRSSDRKWPSIISVVQMPAVFNSPDQVGINHTPEPPPAKVMTWDKFWDKNADLDPDQWFFSDDEGHWVQKVKEGGMTIGHLDDSKVS